MKLALHTYFHSYFVIVCIVFCIVYKNEVKIAFSLKQRQPNLLQEFCSSLDSDKTDYIGQVGFFFN